MKEINEFALGIVEELKGKGQKAKVAILTQTFSLITSNVYDQIMAKVKKDAKKG